jgi:hypothetical protein
MGPASRHGPPASIHDICASIQSLTGPEWVRIRTFAATLLWETDFASPDELINETLERFLSGSRSWPKDVAFLTCLCNAMKSVADGDRGLIHKRYEVEATTDQPSDLMAGKDTHIESAEQEALKDERRVAAARDLAHIYAVFQDDEEVNWVLLGIEDRMPPADLQAISGMTQTQYETARKRLRRKVMQLFKAWRKQ